MKRNEPIKKLLLDQLRKTPIIEAACQKAGISRMTFYRWKAQSKSFAKQTDEAVADGRMLVSDLAENQLISAVKDRNISAIMYWLRHHHPSYADKLELNAHIKEVHELSTAQKRLIQKALRMAKLPGMTDSSRNPKRPRYEKKKEEK